MEQLYRVNDNLKCKKNYIYGNGIHALIVGEYYMGNQIHFEGFVAENGKGDILGKPVISLDELRKIPEANVMITESEWQEIYDKVYEYIEPEHIYINTTWIPKRFPCIACKNELTFSGNALFVPFLVERMFRGEEKTTFMMHCPKCGIYYSYYRPTDEEIGRLYSGYREEVYQKQRQKYEENYTKEFNKSLYEPIDGGRDRRDKIFNFIEEFVETDENMNILDYGGDKGQFIPHQFLNAKKYVYEISGTDTLEDINLITDCNELYSYNWSIILCNMVMEHVSDIEGCFSELISCMNDKSVLYIEVPIERYMENREISFIHEHINFFREKTFYEMAKLFGVEVAKSETTDAIRCVIKKKS